MMEFICSAPIWSANAGSSGAGSTFRPEGWWVASRLSRKPTSRRSNEPTASTMVCCGASLSMTAMSPNCRSASTSATGPSARCARITPRLVASTDLPAPPLVENTVMTRPLVLGSSSGVELANDPTEAEGPAGAMVALTRRTASLSWPVSTGAPRTSRTPERMARWKTSVERSSAMRMAPTSDRRASRPSAPVTPGTRAQDGPSTSRNGEVNRSSTPSMDSRAMARSPSCIERRLRTDGSASTTTMGVCVSDVGNVDMALGDCVGPLWGGGSSAQRYSLMIVVRTWGGRWMAAREERRRPGRRVSWCSWPRPGRRGSGPSRCPTAGSRGRPRRSGGARSPWTPGSGRGSPPAPTAGSGRLRAGR